MEELERVESPEETKETEGINPEYKDAFRALIEKFDIEERPTRNDIRREIEHGEAFWTGHHDVYWNNQLQRWDTPRSAYIAGLTDDASALDYDKYVNTYRAHGKSIVAATSVEFPKFMFLPNDFTNPVDIITAEAYSKAAAVVQNQNQGRKLFAKAFYIRWNQHFVAIYNYNRESDTFGVVPVDHEAMVPGEEEQMLCASCGASGGDGSGTCMNCGGQIQSQMIPAMQKKVTTELVPQRREILEVYGPKNVKIPVHVCRQEDLPYLILDQDFHFSKALAEFKRLKDKIGVYSLLEDEQLLRQPRYHGNKYMVVVSQCWIRPWAFYTLESEELAEKLQRDFPNGVRIVSINGEIVLAIDENLDDHWTLSTSATSDTIHDDPLGKDLLPLNQIQDELLQQTLETIKQAIPELFADPEVLDFRAYGKTEKRPGTVSPAEPRAGKGLSEAFFESRSATLSKEVDGFENKLQQLMQLVVHAFPSIFGGQAAGGSGTYAEYARSAQQALQVLGLDYTPIVDAFGTAMKKAVKSFLENMVGSKLNTSYQEGGIRREVTIDKEEVSGKVGDVSLESAAQIPLSWAELRTVIIEFIQGGNPQLLATLFHPENTTFVKSILGVQQLYIPGEPDRKRQLLEIDELLDAEPTEDMPADPIMQRVQGPTMKSSVEVSESDNHMLHIETINVWEVSEAGATAKKTNPAGYQNITLHKKEHQMMLAPVQPQQAPAPGFGNAPPKPPQGQSQGPIPGPMNPQGGM